ncbi:sensor histidine kinase [Ekhidna sp.]|uniref:sensor histidine kinase n=1 Tax=Ekhidna sp. TaxID=2608089 RepID=UPI003B50D709
MGKGFKFWERPLYINVIEFATVILVGYIFTYIIRVQERKYFNDDASELTLNRAGKELLSVIGVALLVVYCTIIPMAAVTDDGLSLSDLVQITIIPTLYIVLYFAIRRGNFYIKAFIQSKLKLQQIENDRLNSELNFLKEQFSPHFLFNGLNNIYFQMDKSVPEAKKSVEKLSELLRYSLYQDQQKLVDISKEVEFIKLYAEVHRVRKDDNLDLQMDFNTDEGKIYPHLLIPLVENAFKYVEGKKPVINMKLNAKKEYAVFTIFNSKRALKRKDGERTGIGLNNLRRRLELLYHQNYDLEILDGEQTFEVTLKLPIK